MSYPVIGRAFRPFFLGAALFSSLSIILWILSYLGWEIIPLSSQYSMTLHAHEMIYGFTMAVVAGFLLTAVANWTQTPPVKNGLLFFLICLWAAGRLILQFDPDLEGAVSLYIVIAFMPFLALFYARPVIATRNFRNLVFVILLALLWALDLWHLLEMDLVPLYAAVLLINVMISVIGGRIIPAFTVMAMRRKGIELPPKPRKYSDILALFSLLALTLLTVLQMTGWPYQLILVAAIIVHLWRWRSFYLSSSWSDPLLWGLHIGYGWLVIGLILLLCADLELVSFHVAIHALTTGSIGGMTAAMMCRITLGHTGRAIKASAATILILLLMLACGLLRVFLPLIDPEAEFLIYGLSGIFWGILWLIYLWEYGGMLLRARPDGKPA